jgi:hypothetical protein
MVQGLSKRVALAVRDGAAFDLGRRRGEIKSVSTRVARVTCVRRTQRVQACDLWASGPLKKEVDAARAGWPWRRG